MTTLTSFAEEKSQLVRQLESGKQQALVTYGTSLTANGAWVSHLEVALEANYPEQCTLTNSAGAGKNSQWGLEQLESRVLKHKPDTVFLEFSINDAVARFDISVETAQANLETMIDRILETNSKCEVILMTMTPGNKYPEGHRSYRKNIEAHYAMYRSVAKERELLLIDHYPQWKALQSSDPQLFKQYVPDTIHAKEQGYSEVVTPAILEALGIRTLDNER
ncbi:MAG: SGNH/GDSL hydrolase family protein [Opitutaceae bacterium]